MYVRNKRGRCNCNNCKDCKELPVMPKNPVLANSYVPYQYVDDDDTLSPMESLANGTTFKKLVDHYTPGESQCILRYLEGTNTCEEVCDNE